MDNQQITPKNRILVIRINLIQGASSGSGLQIWRAAANILNKQSRTADKGWSSSSGIWSGANNSSLVANCHNGPRTWTYSLDKRPKLMNKKLHNLYSSPSIIRMTKTRRMTLAGNVARTGRIGML
jgi:hypothetical protein